MRALEALSYRATPAGAGSAIALRRPKAIAQLFTLTWAEAR